MVEILYSCPCQMNEDETPRKDFLRLISNSDYPYEIEVNLVNRILGDQLSVCVGKEDAKELIDALNTHFGF